MTLVMPQIPQYPSGVTGRGKTRNIGILNETRNNVILSEAKDLSAQ